MNKNQLTITNKIGAMSLEAEYNGVPVLIDYWQNPLKETFVDLEGVFDEETAKYLELTQDEKKFILNETINYLIKMRLIPNGI